MREDGLDLGGRVPKQTLDQLKPGVRTAETETDLVGCLWGVSMLRRAENVQVSTDAAPEGL